MAWEIYLEVELTVNRKVSVINHLINFDVLRLIFHLIDENERYELRSNIRYLIFLPVTS